MANKNWTEIFHYFLGHENASYADLAKKFSVPVGTIKYQAAKENWQEKRKELWDNAHKKLEEEMTIKIVELKKQQADFGRMLQAKAAKSMASGKYEPKSASQIERYIRTGVAIERDGLGMNTNQGYISFKTKKDFIAFVKKIIEATKNSEQTNEITEKPNDELLLEDGTQKEKTS